MKLIKNCFSILLCFLLFVLLVLLSLLYSIKSTLTSPAVITKYIQQMDLLDLAPKLVDTYIEEQFSEKNLENPLTKKERKERQQKKEETRDLANEIVASVDRNDEKVLKDIVVVNLNEVFDFANSSDQRDLKFTIKGLRPIIVDGVVSSSLVEYLHAPFDMCERPGQKNCVAKEDFATLLDRVLTGEFEEKDILAVYPKCEPGFNPKREEEKLPVCLTKADLAKIEKEGVTSFFGNDDKDKNNTKSNKEEKKFNGLKEEYVVKYSDISPNAIKAREFYAKFRLGLLIATFILGILALLVFLFKGKYGFKWLAAVLFVAGGLVTFSAVVAKSIVNDKKYLVFDRLPDYEVLVGEATKLSDLFVQELFTKLLLFGVGMVVLGVLFMLIYLFAFDHQSRDEAPTKKVSV